MRELELARRLREAEREILARSPEHQLQPSLDRIERLMDLLAEPQRTYPVVHVTGTNGKTSTTRIIDAILRELGLHTGRFTSPHLHSMRERIVEGGSPVGAEEFLAAYDEISPFVAMVDEQSVADGGPRMTYFEVLTALAYVAFADKPIDVAVIEVGMGGAWDATNVANGTVSVITPIDLDHQHFLGDTRRDIALEKAGIIKPGGIAVTAEQEPEVLDVLAARAAEVGARLVIEGVDVGVDEHTVAVGGQVVSIRGLAGTYADLFIPLHGAHQAHNLLLAIVAVEALMGGGEQALNPQLLAAALASVTSPGRLEMVRTSPTIFVDAAHNPAGARALAAAIESSFTFTRLIGLLGILGDKDAAAMLEALEPVLDHVVITRSSSPRALAAPDLAALAGEIFGDHRITVVPELPDAIDAAVELADEGGVGGAVIATGSVTTAAEVRALLGQTDG